MSNQCAALVISFKFNFIAEWASSSWHRLGCPVYVLHVGKTPAQVNDFRPAFEIAGMAAMGSSITEHGQLLDMACGLLPLAATPDPPDASEGFMFLRNMYAGTQALAIVDHDVLFTEDGSTAACMREFAGAVIGGSEALACVFSAPWYAERHFRHFTTWPFFTITAGDIDWSYALDRERISCRSWQRLTYDHVNDMRSVERRYISTYLDVGQLLGLELAARGKLARREAVIMPAHEHISGSWYYGSQYQYQAHSESALTDIILDGNTNIRQPDVDAARELPLKWLHRVFDKRGENNKTN